MAVIFLLFNVGSDEYIQYCFLIVDKFTVQIFFWGGGIKLTLLRLAFFKHGKSGTKKECLTCESF